MQVGPEGGLLAAGEVGNITVRFSPQEVEGCSRRIVATIPNLAAGLQPPARSLNASVLRPWCHFDLPTSDYISAGAMSTSLLLLKSCLHALLLGYQSMLSSSCCGNTGS